jgi:hypothetical protein
MISWVVTKVERADQASSSTFTAEIRKNTSGSRILEFSDFRVMIVLGA